MITLGQRIKNMRGSTSQKDAAERAGISLKTWQNYEQDLSLPGSDSILKICQTYNVSPNWLLLGEEEQANSCSSEYSYIPFYIQPAAAGHGALVEDNTIGRYMAFRTDWIKTFLRANVRDLFLMPVTGDSMNPTLKHKDAILVDKGHTNPTPGDIFVISMDDQVVVKEVQPLAPKPKTADSVYETPQSLDRPIQAISHNKEYPPIILDPWDIPNLRIVGKVLWIGRTLA